MLGIDLAIILSVNLIVSIDSMHPLSLTSVGTQAGADKTAGNLRSASSNNSQDTEFNSLFNSSLEEHSTPNGSSTDPAGIGFMTAALTASAQGGQGLPETGSLLPPVGPDGLPVTTPLAEESLDNLLTGVDATLTSQAATAEKLPEGTTVKGELSQAAVLASGIIPLNTLSTHQSAENAALLASNGVTVTSTSVLASTPVHVAQTDQSLMKSPLPSASLQTMVATSDGSLQQQASGGESGLAGQETRSSLPVAEFSLPDVNDKQDFRFIEKQLAQSTKDILGAAATSVPGILSKLSPDSLKAVGESYQLHQPMHKPNWSKEFGNRMVWLAKEGIQSAQLRLNPASLGKIDINISIQNDQANISFISHHGSVKDIIDASLPRLREMMNDAGVKLDQVNVSTQANAQEQKQSSGPQAGLPQGSTRKNTQEEMDLPVDEAAQSVITDMHSAVDFYA